MRQAISSIFIIIAMSLPVTVHAGTPASEITVSIKGADEVHLLIYPERILTRTAVTPEMLEQNHKQQKVIRPLPEEGWKALDVALMGTKWKPTDKIGDYRWALHVRAKSRDLVVAYIDRKAGIALVDGKRLVVSGKLLPWLATQDEK